MLTDTGTALSKTIQKYTKAPYNHVSIALDENLNELYSFGRRHPKNPLYGGFVKEDVLYGTYSYYPKTTCQIYELKVNDKQYKKIERIIGNFKNKERQYIYNLIGLFGVVVKRPIEVEYAYFCSQFVGEVLRRSGINLIDKPSGLIQPNDFINNENLQMVYEGLLNNYEPIKKYKVLITNKGRRSFRKDIIKPIYNGIKLNYYREISMPVRNELINPTKLKVKNNIKKLTEIFDDSED